MGSDSGSKGARADNRYGVVNYILETNKSLHTVPYT